MFLCEDSGEQVGYTHGAMSTGNGKRLLCVEREFPVRVLERQLLVSPLPVLPDRRILPSIPGHEQGLGVERRAGSDERTFDEWDQALGCLGVLHARR